MEGALDWGGEGGLRLRLRSPFGLRLKKISSNGDEAGIEAGSSYSKKLEYPVSIDKPRPAAPGACLLRQCACTASEASTSFNNDKL